ncbi:hypothetical protein CPB84DRAFT_1695023, partial [Gymnopilus junonius]
LEKYFEYNAYPSSKHQEILAAKSDMTRRQIEVWFQNHRNRAKKEDRVLKRFNSASDYPLEVALSVLPCGNLSQVNRLPTPSSEEDSGSETPDEFDDVSVYRVHLRIILTFLLFYAGSQINLVHRQLQFLQASTCIPNFISFKVSGAIPL